MSGRLGAFRTFLANAGVVASAIPAATSTPPAAEGAAPPEGEFIRVEEAQTATEAAMATAERKGFAAANDRMHAVLTSDVGKKQPGAAVELLHKSPDMSADACISTLTAMCGAIVEPAPAAAAAPKGPDLNNTPKPAVEPAPIAPNANEGTDANALWDGVQGTKNGQKITTGGAGVLQ